jgi:hypothetical protein
MSHINQPSVSSNTQHLIKTLILPTSALTSDYHYRTLPESLNNLSVCHHVCHGCAGKDPDSAVMTTWAGSMISYGLIASLY